MWEKITFEWTVLDFKFNDLKEDFGSVKGENW